VTLVAVGLLVGLTACHSTWLSTDSKYSAFDVCTTSVKQRLNSPSNATFRDPTANNGDTTFTPSLNGKVYAISSSVDSENGLGARLRSTFECTVAHGEGDAWRVTQLEIHGGDYSNR